MRKEDEYLHLVECRGISSRFEVRVCTKESSNLCFFEVSYLFTYLSLKLSNAKFLVETTNACS